MITALDHVQLTAPPGSEALLRAFYGDVLQMAEIPKPRPLAERGGCWFAADGGRVRLYLGIEQGFRPNTKAHPGLTVSEIDDFAQRLANWAHSWSGTTACRPTAASTPPTPWETSWSSSKPGREPVTAKPAPAQGAARPSASNGRPREKRICVSTQEVGDFPGHPCVPVPGST